jgi:hypothetical protein
MDIEGVFGDTGSDADGLPENFCAVSALSWGVVTWPDI